jgi:hypothetical protein
MMTMSYFFAFATPFAFAFATPSPFSRLHSLNTVGIA